MSTQEIKEALEARDGAIRVSLDKLVEKQDRLGDKIASLEQKGAAAFDLTGAPPRPSLMKVIKHLANPRDNPLDGLEGEWHQELSRKSGRSFAGAVFVPLRTKTLDYNTPNFGGSPLTSAAGSSLVAQQLHPELIDLLRQESVVMQQGLTMIDAQGDLDLPKKTTGATGHWFGGDGADSITESNPVFTTVQLRPKFAAGLVKVSYKMMTQTGGGVEQIIAQDLAATLAEQIDLAALQGTGSNSQPTGVLNQSSIGSLTWGGTSSPLGNTTRFWWDDALASQKNLIDAKAYSGSLSWLCDSASWKIIQHQVSTADEHMSLLDAQGRLLGLPIQPTTHMAANTVLLGNWADLVLATWGGIALAADPGGDNFSKGDLSIRAILPCDFAVRHAASFVKNVRP